MKANTGKYHLLSGNGSSKITTGNKTISSGKCEKLLGIKIDNNQNFKEKFKESVLCLDLHHNEFWVEETYNEFFRNLSLVILSSCMDVSKPKTKRLH